MKIYDLKDCQVELVETGVSVICNLPSTGYSLQLIIIFTKTIKKGLLNQPLSTENHNWFMQKVIEIMPAFIYAYETERSIKKGGT